MRAVPPRFMDFLLTTLLPRYLPQGVREASRGGHQSGGFLEIIPRGGMRGCSPEMARDPMRADLNLLGESGEVNYRMGTWPPLEEQVGSYSSDLVSSQSYGDNREEGSVGPNLCGDWE
jgi:hypothetical protein